MTIKQRAEAILANLSLDDKCRLLAGRTPFHTVAIPEQGIPELVVTDGPLGVRTMPKEREPERADGPATAFPALTCFAASFDPPLVARASAVMAEETRALGCDLLLAPGVNLIREPRSGRSFEYFSEDPLHAALMGCAYVRGLQDHGVGASVKHFVANDVERDRFHSDSLMDERSLREVHLLPFEWIAQDAEPWTIMAAYNRLNGVFCTENPGLLQGIFRSELGYEGVIVSDWGAVHSCEESVLAGCDLQMPGPDRQRGELLAHAVRFGRVPESAVDACCRRVITLALRAEAGRSLFPAPQAHTHEHALVSQQMAEAGLVLMQNDGDCLPLQLQAGQTLALIGPNASQGCLRGGGSSRVFPEHWVSLEEGLRAALPEGVELLVEQGCSNLVDAEELREDVVNEAGEPGFDLFYHEGGDCSGPVLRRDSSSTASKSFFNPGNIGLPEGCSVCFTGIWTPRQSGRWKLQLGCRGFNTAQLFVDDEPLLQADSADDHTRLAFLANTAQHLRVEAGRSYRLRVEMHAGTHVSLAASFDPPPEEDDRLDRAVAAAQKADAVVVAIGHPCHYESEGFDRPDLALPGRQDELVAAVAAVNRRTAVVLTTGAPVLLPWLQQVPSLLLAHLPGQYGGHACARAVLGLVNPAGRLPVTWPARIEDTPGFTGSGYRRVVYGENIHVGHRWYDARDLQPLFPFGHGLSYSRFQWSDLQVPERIDPSQDQQLRLTISNSSDRDGDEVVQVYLEPPADARLPRPVRQLAGFVRASIPAHSSQEIAITIPWRAWRVYDPDRGWLVPAGRYGLVAAASSRDLRLHASIDITA
ncbi:MAG: glycoside hydrolase family 3 C-terminal domain-containing protein [Planctomycetota bacterium]